MTNNPATQSSAGQPSDEEVQAAIAREQQAQMSYLHDRVLQLSITNARLEADLDAFRAGAGNHHSPATDPEGPA